MLAKVYMKSLRSLEVKRAILIHNSTSLRVRLIPSLLNILRRIYKQVRTRCRQQWPGRWDSSRSSNIKPISKTWQRVNWDSSTRKSWLSYSAMTSLWTLKNIRLPYSRDTKLKKSFTLRELWKLTDGNSKKSSSWQLLTMAIFIWHHKMMTK